MMMDQITDDKLHELENINNDHSGEVDTNGVEKNESQDTESKTKCKIENEEYNQREEAKNNCDKNPIIITTTTTITNSDNQKPRRQFTLPIRSMTLGSSSSSDMNDNDNGTAVTKTSSSKVHQLIQSCSLEQSSSLSSSTTATTQIHITSADNNFIPKFKTKRFYETEDDNTLMTQIFSQTIRSTSVTPTDECDVTELLQDIANREQQQQQQQQQSHKDQQQSMIASSSTTTITTVSTNNNDQKSIPSIKTTPSPPPLASSPTFSSMNYLMNDTDNYSTTEYSNAESQTDNIEMYNEPNMSSLLDNLQSDCEEFIDKSDTEEIVDPDYNPWDIKTKTIPSNTINTEQTINNCNNMSSNNFNTTTATTSTNTINNNLRSQTSASSSLLPSSSSSSPTIMSTIKTTDSNNQGPIKRRPSIVVEFYNDDLTKNLEYEVEGGEIESHHVHVPTPTTPSIPSVSLPAAMAAAKFSYFDTTIEEEDDDDELNNINNSVIINDNFDDNNSSRQDNDDSISNSNIIEGIVEENEEEENDEHHNSDDNTGPNKIGTLVTNNNNNNNNNNCDSTLNSKNLIYNNQNVISTVVDDNTKILSHQNNQNERCGLSSASPVSSSSSSSSSTASSPSSAGSHENHNYDESNSKIDMHASKKYTIMENQVNQQSSSVSTTATTKKSSITKKISSSTRTTSSTSYVTSSTKDLNEVINNSNNKAITGNNDITTTTSTTSEQNGSSDGLQLKITSKETKLQQSNTTIEKIATKKKSDSTNNEGSKKKSKKSKKSDAEKENISVNGKESFTKINKEIKKVIPSNMRLHDDDLSNIDVKSLKKIYLLEQPPVNRKFKENNCKQYQIPLNRSVSVKQLCRSFGDLTAIKAYGNNIDNLKRAKSVSDVRSIEIGISVKQLKSSFSKFDALQKKNILHVRSSDAGKAQEKFNDVNSEIEKNCRSCGKIVYKMEEIKAEKCIWHRNCFKCNECGKQLNVDTYQSHESVLYCKPHFKLLFAPKAVENNEPARPKKPELIIRENQPVELPADVVRASDKPDLGLEELHQLDVKSRFQVFEHLQDQQTTSEQNSSIERSPSGVTRSASILSKLAKFKAKGMDTGVTDEALSGIPLEQSSSDEDNDDEIDENDPDAALIRSKRIQKERPMSFSNMNDIKSKFEKGHALTREERREERKQEIQNIRSRLFMGKQAKIKEMYQQAVAESEHAITSTGKKPEIDIGDKAKSLKEKFEKGEIFNKEDHENDEANHRAQDEEMAVFEQGISKKSRSIFMELDASASKPPQLTPQPTTPRSADANKIKQVSPLQSDKLKPFSSENVVKYDEKPDDIKIETSEISSKFKFFETYKPTEQKKKEFRITPPREGVVKMPSPERDSENYVDNDIIRSDEKVDDPSVVAQTQTATKMLSIFRQMEQNKHEHKNDEGLKPLKQFTPPPNDNRRVYDNNESEEECSGSEEDEEGEEEEDEQESENEKQNNRYEDEYLKQAKLEARAKQLRAKFEKWEANEIRREMSNGTINVYENADNDSQIESAKTLRAKFESMREQNNTSPNRPKIKVNRFV